MYAMLDPFRLCLVMTKYDNFQSEFRWLRQRVPWAYIIATFITSLEDNLTQKIDFTRPGHYVTQIANLIYSLINLFISYGSAK